MNYRRRLDPRRENGPGAIPEEIPRGVPRSPLRDAVGEGERQDASDRWHVRRRRSGRQLAAPPRRLFGDPAQQVEVDPVTVRAPRRGSDAAEGVNTGLEVHAGDLGSATQRVALAEDGGDIAGERGRAFGPGAKRHVRQSRVHAERGHPATMQGGVAAIVDRVELSQELAGLRVGRG